MALRNGRIYLLKHSLCPQTTNLKPWPGSTHKKISYHATITMAKPFLFGFILLPWFWNTETSLIHNQHGKRKHTILYGFLLSYPTNKWGKDGVPGSDLAWPGYCGHLGREPVTAIHQPLFLLPPFALQIK